MIVMTRNSRRGFAQLLLGSVADAVVRSSKLPVLIVPPRAGKADLDRLPVIRRILLPIDGSELSDELLPIARNIGAATGVRFTLLWVGRSALDGVKNAVQPERDRDENKRMMFYLLERAASFVPGTVDVVVRGSPTGNVAATIVKDADELGADIIGMATHARPPIGRTVFGSVADDVLNAAARPVLVYRPPRAASEQTEVHRVWEYAGDQGMAVL
jgi:nucleotide-binding universal stress UspA family protein